MKKIFLLFICVWLGFAPVLMARTAEEDRRIEEETRKSLRPTERPIYQERKLPTQPSEPLDYFRQLLSKEVALVSDAFKMLVVLLGQEEQYPDLDSQIAFFKQENIIPEEISPGFEPHKPLRKGVAAYMFAKALKIKGGLGWRLFRQSQRYALKELIYQGIIPPGYVKDIVTGRELVLILTGAANYLSETRQAPTPDLSQ